MSTLEQKSAAPQVDERKPLVSVVIPCLNEEENIELCVTAAMAAMAALEEAQ